MGIIILLLLVGIEIGMLVFRLRTKSCQSGWKNRIRVGTFVGIMLLVIVQTIQLGFRWNLLLIVLLIQAVVSLVGLIKQSRQNQVKPEKPFKAISAVGSCVRRNIFIVTLLIPAILFPQFKTSDVTGAYEVTTASYTLEDPNRLESYVALGGSENRKVTIQFWYPETQETDKDFPVVIFSHGAFGFRGSNYSTFMELASNGYVVCSIDHTYHSFFTKQTDGKVITVDQDFLKGGKR